MDCVISEKREANVNMINNNDDDDNINKFLYTCMFRDYLPTVTIAFIVIN